MPFLATLKQSLAMTSTHGTSNRSQNNEHHRANLTHLPDEVFEMIVNKLERTTDITNLRQSNKRLALLTTHLIAARCPPDRTCLNATSSLKILTTGSRTPLLNGTITSLTLSAPSWKTPGSLATYGTGLREVHLLRLTTLRLSSMRLAHAGDLIHFLTAHSPTLRNLHSATSTPQTSRAGAPSLCELPNATAYRLSNSETSTTASRSRSRSRRR
jgi:hypothetical protein